MIAQSAKRYRSDIRIVTQNAEAFSIIGVPDTGSPISRAGSDATLLFVPGYSKNRLAVPRKTTNRPSRLDIPNLNLGLSRVSASEQARPIRTELAMHLSCPNRELNNPRFAKSMAHTSPTLAAVILVHFVKNSAATVPEK